MKVNGVYLASGKVQSRQTFGNNSKSVAGLLGTIDKMHLDDKVGLTLKKMDIGDFLIVSPNMDGSYKDVQKLTIFFQDSIKRILHIANEKFKKVLVFTKSNPETTDFLNVNYDAVRVNTIDVQPFHAMKVKPGDRIWGETLRSVLIKGENEVPKELEQYSMLVAEQYDPREISSLSFAVNRQNAHFEHRLGQ